MKLVFAVVLEVTHPDDVAAVRVNPERYAGKALYYGGKGNAGYNMTLVGGVEIVEDGEA